MRTLQGVKVEQKPTSAFFVVLKSSCWLLLVCSRAGRPAAEAVHSGSINTADEAGAAQSQHDEGWTQQPECTRHVAATYKPVVHFNEWKIFKMIHWKMFVRVWLTVTFNCMMLIFPLLCLMCCRRSSSGSWRNVTGCGGKARWHSLMEYSPVI